MVNLAFFVTVCFAVGLSSISYAIVVEDGIRVFQVAEDPPGSELCALDAPSTSLSLNSALDCALECQRFSFCENFNFNVNKTCEIFFNRPKCYGPTPSCMHYQAQSDQPYAGIPAENCSLPFTYGGRLYNECVANLNGDGCNACLTANRTLVPCMRKLTDNIRATFVMVNVTIPTFIKTSLLMSINNWIVIQQRVDAGLSFDKTWAIYKNGFGNISSNFWLGLEKMHQLTINVPYRLRIEIQSMDNNRWFSAEYDSFCITSESLGYALNVSGYVGDAGDALNNMNNSGVLFHNGMKFSTQDKDNDMFHNGSCALKYTSGFWFNQCCYTCLNCAYNSNQFSWFSLPDLGLANTVQLKASRMMIKAV